MASTIEQETSDVLAQLEQTLENIIVEREEAEYHARELSINDFSNLEIVDENSPASSNSTVISEPCEMEGRESMAITPVCDLHNCFCYCCCSCDELYTKEDFANSYHCFVLFPITSTACNYCLIGMDYPADDYEFIPQRHCLDFAGLCMPLTLPVDIACIVPRMIFQISKIICLGI